MGVAAILVMWSLPFKKNYGSPIVMGLQKWNLSSIGLVVSEEMFENVDGQQTMDDGVIGILKAHPWATFSSGELKSNQSI